MYKLLCKSSIGCLGVTTSPSLPFQHNPHLGRVLALGELINVVGKAFLHLRRGRRAVGELQGLLQRLRFDGDFDQTGEHFL